MLVIAFKHNKHNTWFKCFFHCVKHLSYPSFLMLCSAAFNCLFTSGISAKCFPSVPFSSGRIKKNHRVPDQVSMMGEEVVACCFFAKTSCTEMAVWAGELSWWGMNFSAIHLICKSSFKMHCTELHKRPDNIASSSILHYAFYPCTQVHKFFPHFHQFWMWKANSGIECFLSTCCHVWIANTTHILEFFSRRVLYKL